MSQPNQLQPKSRAPLSLAPPASKLGYHSQAIENPRRRLPGTPLSSETTCVLGLHDPSGPGTAKLTTLDDAGSFSSVQPTFGRLLITALPCTAGSLTPRLCRPTPGNGQRLDVTVRTPQFGIHPAETCSSEAHSSEIRSEVTSLLADPTHGPLLHCIKPAFAVHKNWQSPQAAGIVPQAKAIHVSQSFAEERRTKLPEGWLSSRTACTTLIWAEPQSWFASRHASGDAKQLGTRSPGKLDQERSAGHQGTRDIQTGPAVQTTPGSYNHWSFASVQRDGLNPTSETAPLAQLLGR